MIFKSIIGIACTCLTFASLNVNATPSYTISGGQLIGVTGLSVDGYGTYDMTLHAGSFDTLFAADNSSVYDFDFADHADSSLYDFMFSSFDGSGLGASDILGCSPITNTYDDCFIATIFDTIIENSIVHREGWANYIVGAEHDWAWGGSIITRSDLDYDYITYATWEVSAVPEPSIALLMASGLIAFGVVRRKARN